MKVQFFSHRGRVRPRNEDAVLVDETAGLFAVADGLGGHAAGDVASSLAVAEVGRSYRDRRAAGWGVLQALSDAVRAAHDTVAAAAARRAECAGMGTTLLAMAVSGHRAHLAHVGDSRAYLLRQEWEQRTLFRLTTDHVVIQHGREYVARVVGIGAADATPDVSFFDLQPGDAVLLATDGLYRELSQDAPGGARKLADLLERGGDALLQAALDAGGHDNITGLVVRTEN